MKKVGVLTYHRPINFGAILQTTAMNNFLRNNGFRGEVIDYRDKRIERSRRLVGNRLSPDFIASIRSLLANVYDLRCFMIKRKRFDEFSRQHIELSNRYHSLSENNKSPFLDQYDYVIVGSDLVWNWEINGGPDPAYFLEGIKYSSAKKISYAASIGNSDIPDAYKSSYKKLLNNFDLISVREDSAKKAICSLIDKEISVVCDPVMLLSMAEWEPMERELDLPDHYILAYIVENNPKVNRIIDAVQKATGIKIVNLSERKKADESIINRCTAGPGEFLYAVHNADYIITNSYHGTVFSLLYKKCFVTIPHTTRGERMVDLLKTFGLQGHVLEDVSHLNLDSFENDYDPVENEMGEFISQSKRWLLEAIDA